MSARDTVINPHRCPTHTNAEKNVGTEDTKRTPHDILVAFPELQNPLGAPSVASFSILSVSPHGILKNVFPYDANAQIK